jgi:hypothetical protein
MRLDSTRADRTRGEQMTTTVRDLKQRQLKRQLQSHTYAVDPERVAAAIIVKLAQGGPLGGPGDPSRGTNAPFRLRQAA